MVVGFRQRTVAFIVPGFRLHDSTSPSSYFNVVFCASFANKRRNAETKHIFIKFIRSKHTLIMDVKHSE